MTVVESNNYRVIYYVTILHKVTLFIFLVSLRKEGDIKYSIKRYKTSVIQVLYPRMGFLFY